MEDPSHYPKSARKKSRRRGNTGGNIDSRSPSAQETKDGPKQDESGRIRGKIDRNPEGEERDHTTNQRTSETG
jgi:hypothetical protein